MGDPTSDALHELVILSDAYPGQFRPEFDLGYWSGVQSGSDRWYVRFEADIADNEFTVTGATAEAALRSAIAEAQSRVK